MTDRDLRNAERGQSDDPQHYLITQLRHGRYDPDNIIQCILNNEDQELAQRCLSVLPQILQDNPKQVIALSIGMVEWWDRTAADDPNHYFGLDDVHSVLTNFLNNNPFEIRHLLDQLGNWHGEADRPSYHQDSYPEANHGGSIAMNILSELDMLDEYQDHDFDHIDYTLAWVWYCGQKASEVHVDYLAHIIWEQIQRRSDFVHEYDPDIVQSLGHLALRAIRDHSLRNDFIEKFDYFKGEIDLISIQNNELEQEFNLFADAFQAGNLLGEGSRPGMTQGQLDANPGIIGRGIERLNAYYTLPQIRNMVIKAFS